MFTWAGWLAACAGPTAVPPGEPETRDITAFADREAREHAAYVVRHGWHTGIALDRLALAESGLLPEVADFPEARFLEFGWGDRDFYMASDETVWLALKAAFTPTLAVMHVAPLQRPPPETAPTVIRLSLSDTAFRQLASIVSGYFDRPAGGSAEAIGRGLYPGSRFYPAEGRFHLFNNCNTWTAQALAAAGVAVSPEGVVTARSLMRRVREAEGMRRRARIGTELAFASQ